MLTALFGINDGSVNLAVNLLILVLVVIWIALIWWTYADARRRIDDSVLVATATAASLFPFIGTIVYTIVRPPEFLADARERDLETRASELRLRRLTETSCPRCEHPIELSWLRCPECQHRLKDPCRSCGRPVDPRWAVCPHCETPLSGSEQRREPGQRARPTRAQGRQRAAAERPEGQRRSESKPPPKRRSSSGSGPASREEGPRREAGGGESARKPAPKRKEGGEESQRPPRRRPTSRT